jgi:hypothetical protein
MSKKTRKQRTPVKMSINGASFTHQYRSRAGSIKNKRHPTHKKNYDSILATIIPIAQNRYRSRAGAHNKSHSKIQQTIVLTFIEMLDTIKLHHWRTMSHATHKATDDIYSKLSENVDQFVEIMLGKSGERIDLTRVHSVPLYDYGDDKQFKNKIESYKKYMIDLTKNTQINLDGNTDLMNLRDEILGNLNQLTYLLTFK